MENHKEKQKSLNTIFDEYASKQHYNDFEELLTNYGIEEKFLKSFKKHLFRICDIVQKQVLEVASENAEIKTITKSTKGILIDRIIKVDKESITNENNIIV